jgi:Carboxypeptidase regulatory-like domain
MRSKLILSMILGAAILFAQGVNAQTPKKTGATITGTVLGADGKPVASAGVSCETSSGLKPRAVHTDAKGRFFITGLKQESYDLRASRNGAYSDWERNIPMRKGQTKDVTLILLNGNTALVGKQPARKKQ